MMKDPLHPGRILRTSLKDLALSVTKAAQVLDVARPNLSNILNGKAGISPEMAIRLERAFGGTAEMWLRLQTAYDLAQAQKKARRLKIKRYLPMEHVPASL